MFRVFATIGSFVFLVVPLNFLYDRIGLIFDIYVKTSVQVSLSEYDHGPCTVGCATTRSNQYDTGHIEFVRHAFESNLRDIFTLRADRQLVQKKTTQLRNQNRSTKKTKRASPTIS